MKDGFLHIMSGPQKGLRIPLKEGLTIGRKKAQLNIDDPRASNLHAQLEFSEDKWQLLDMGSTNGIYFKGKKLAHLVLEDDIEFSIGDTIIKITILDTTTAPIIDGDASNEHEESELIKKDLSNSSNKNILDTASVVVDEVDLPEIPQYDEEDMLVINSAVAAMDTEEEKTKQPEKPKEELEKLEAPKWVKNIIKTLQALKIKDHKPLDIKPFQQIIELTIFRGLQTGTKWTLGYGPRAVGKKSLDLPIFDSTAPEVCFTVHPAAGGPKYQTEHSDSVLINGEKKAEEILKPGDIIKIGNTEIEVQLLL